MSEQQPTAYELCYTTPPGMAHYRGTGPSGETCSSCKHFMGHKRRKGRIEIVAARCKRYMRMLRANGVRAVPVYLLDPDTASCRFHELRGQPGRKRAAA
jgi:hypothetical protein